MRDSPQLLRRIVHDIFTGRSVVRLLRVRALICLAICIAYLLSPFDLVPEVIFGVFGLLDDIVVILVILMYFGAVYRAAMVQRLVHRPPN